jgi:NADH dehydrogenase
VLGGGGFVGRTLVPKLVASGRQVTVLTRRPERRRHLLTTPGVRLVRADVHNRAELEKYFSGMDAVINLVGILNEFRYQKFRDVHVKLPGDIMRACWKASVPRLLHMSALNADAGTGMSEYLRTKGEAEQLLHVDAGDHLHVTRFRPSVIFGPHDNFFNLFARLLRYSPWVFPLAAGQARLWPVYVEDVAQAFINTLENTSSYDQRYDLCGPHEYTLEELVKYTAQLAGYRRMIFSLGNRLSMLQAFLLEMAPGKPFTLDNFHSLQTAGNCQNDGLSRLGIHKTPVEAVVPAYISHIHSRARYDDFRRHARRDEDSHS